MCQQKYLGVTIQRYGECTLLRRDYSDAEAKALVLDWLMRHGRWGAHYYPLDTLVNRLSHVVRNDGRRLRRIIGELQQENYVVVHKRGNTISLNPSRSREIGEYVERIMRL
jgi:hypothetical protein